MEHPTSYLHVYGMVYYAQAPISVKMWLLSAES